MNIKNEKPKQRKRVQITFTQESLTKQEFAEENDINNIIKRAKITGELPVSSRQPLYGDFTNVPQYQEALNIVNEAQEAFESLPSLVRERFQNNPAMMLDFLADPKNRAEAVKLGLIGGDTPKPAPTDLPKQPETPEKTPPQAKA